MTVDMIREKAEYYFSKKEIVHIKKFNKTYYNGLLKDVSNDFLIIIDRKVGEVFVSLSEIEDFDKFKEIGK